MLPVIVKANVKIESRRAKKNARKRLIKKMSPVQRRKGLWRPAQKRETNRPGQWVGMY